MTKGTKYLIIAISVVLSSLLFLQDSTRGLPVLAEETMDDAVAKEIDTALFEKVNLLDESVDFPRPALKVGAMLKKLVKKYPSEPRYLLALAENQISRSQFSKAEATMVKMAQLHPDKAAGLEKLSQFYAERVKPGKQIAALRKLADLKQGEKKVAVLKRILQANDTHLLTAVSKESVLREIVSILPEDSKPVVDLVNELMQKKKLAEALAETEGAISRFPKHANAFVSRKGLIIWKMGQAEKALALYDVEMDIYQDIPLIRNYLDLLSKMGKRTEVERDLQRKHRLNTLSRKEFQKHFLLLRSKNDRAGALKVAKQFISKNKPLSYPDQYLLAKALYSNGDLAVSWKLMYGAYLKASAAEKEESNVNLVHWAGQLGSFRPNLPAQGSRMVFTNRHFDSMPGIQGGLASLLFNKQDLAWRFNDLARTSASYEDARVHYSLFKNFASDYPNSDSLPSLYSGIIRSLNSYGRSHEALKYAEKFMNSYQESKLYYSVAEAALESLKLLKQKSRIETLYKELLARADSRKEQEKYNNYLSKLEQFYTSANQLPKVVSLYWEQITAHPDNEDLYSRFLRFLSRYRIYNEELKVYKQAVARFKNNSYYDKMARWYIRAKQKNNFHELTRKLVQTFSDSELSEFLRDHLRFVSNNGKVMHPDTVFYQTMYEYANKRFPRNLNFVNKLLSHYQSFQLKDKYLAMAKKYFYASPKIRDRLLRFMSAEKILEKSVAGIPGGGDLSRSIVFKSMNSRAPKNLAEALVQKYSKDERGVVPEVDSRAGPAEKLFLAGAAGWNSYFEASLPVYLDLKKSYPQMTDIAEKAATLHRSVGENIKSQAVYENLGKLHPLNKEYPTLAGEVAMENGDFPTAKKNWYRITQARPAEQDRYLEVATILWDYYRFGESAEAINKGRELLKSPRLFGARLAAVYESDKNYARAVDEYILTVVENYDRYYEKYSSEDRLNYLARKRGMKAQIKSRYQALSSADKDNPDFIRAWYDFLNSMDEKQEGVELLKSSIAKYADKEFINWLAGRFRDSREHTSEGECYHQIMAMEGENVTNLLQLSLYLERQNKLDEADAVLEKRVTMTRTDQPEAMGDYIATLEEAAGFSWRHDFVDPAFSRWETAARLKSGYSQKVSLHNLTKKLILVDRFDKATTILHELLKQDPSSSDYFNTLAGIFTEKEDYPGLIALFRQRIEVVRNDQKLDRDGRKFQLNQLRVKLVSNLEKLGDFTNALDQYIEMINTDFQNSSYLENALLLAENEGLLDRLMNYYISTSEKSFKDHRWNFVLARLYELQNKLPQAKSQWSKAIVNEPQLIELRQSLAKNLINQKQYPEAIEQYQEIYRLDERNSYWLKSIATTQAMSGDFAAAKETLKQLLTESALNYDTYFEVAEYYSDWADLPLALATMEEGLGVLKKDIYKNRLTGNRLNQYIEVAIKVGKVEATFDALLSLNQVYTAEAGKEMNSQAWVARSGQNLTFQTFSDKFAKAASDFANEGNLKRMQIRLRSILDSNITEYKKHSVNSNSVLKRNAAASIRWVGAVATEMGFADIAVKAITEGYEKRQSDDHDGRSYSERDYRLLAHLRARFNWEETLELFWREEPGKAKVQFYDVELIATLFQNFKSEDEELEVLKNFGAYYQVARLVFLLDKAGDKARMEILAGKFHDTYNGLVLPNYLMNKGYTDLALTALDKTTRNSLWKDSKKLIIGTRLNRDETGLRMSQSPADIMQNKPVARRLGVNVANAFKGKDFYDFLPHYASYLEKFGAEGDYEKFISGLPEHSPKSALLQKKAGDWYANHQLWVKAVYHYDLALQLSPDSYEVLAAYGELELKKGNSAEALKQWQRLIPAGSKGDKYQRWMEVLWKHGFEEEAIAGVTEYLVYNTGKELQWIDRNLFYPFASLMFENDRQDALIALAEGFASNKSEPMEFLLGMYQDIEEVPQVKVVILDKIIKIQGGLNNDEDNAYKNWLEDAIEFAGEHEGFVGYALKWCQLYESAGYHEKPSYRIGNKKDYHFIKGGFLLGNDQLQKALAEFKSYMEPDDDYSGSKADDVYQALKDGGFTDEANSFILAFYKDALANGNNSQDFYFAYASHLVEKAEAESLALAISYLDKLVFNSFDSKADLSRVAEMLEEKGERRSALNYRMKLQDIVPDDNNNTLNIALTLSKTDKKPEALELMKKVLNADAGVKLTAEWAALYASLFVADSQASAAEIDRLKALTEKSESSAILVFELLKAGGDSAGAIENAELSIKSMVKPGVLSLSLAEYLQEKGEFEKALKYGLISRNIYPDHKNAMVVLNALISLGRKEQALFMVTAENYWLRTSPDSSRIGEITGLIGEDKLRFMEKMFEIAVESEQREIAESYYRMIRELAADLGLKASVTKDELKILRKKLEAENSRFKIIEAIAN